MKKIIVSLLLTAVYQISVAQPIPAKSIEDSVLGWMKVYNFKGAKAALKVEDKFYSIAQLSICDSLVNWMQASYLPKGGLGDIKRSVSDKLGPYNQADKSLPRKYGAEASIYSQLKYNASGKRVLLTSDAIYWSIFVNEPVGIGIDPICTPAQYYFTLPTFKEHGVADNDPQVTSMTTNPNTKKYPSYIKRNENSMFEPSLLLYPENGFPYVKVTKREYIDQLAAAIERRYLFDKDEAFKKWFTDASRASARKYADDNYQKRIQVLKKNKEKYKNSMDEVAEIFDTQPSVFLENYPDVFEGSGASSLKLTVYKINPVIAERCNTDKPQWITVTWNGGLNNVVGHYLHESITNNFNFDYLFNFFFHPEKVKGQPYRPLHSPSSKEAVVIVEASEGSKKNINDPKVFYSDDFSATSTGKNPVGWKSELGMNGTTALVTSPENLDGTWVELKGHRITAKLLKKPLPQNFTITYDIAVPQNFTWGAKGLTMLLSKETSPGNAESFIKLKLRPGSGGNDGEATLETKFPSPPGYSNGTKWYAATGFSNNKKVNRITVTITKKDERLQVFVGQTKIADYEKAIPSAHLFNAFSFDCGGNSGDIDKYYVSNIKIVKE